MKITKQKDNKRALTFYKLAFNFAEPYKILVDYTFIQIALQHKIYLKEQIPTLLSGRCKLLVTTCMISEMRQLGDPVKGAYLICKNYERYVCGHTEGSLDARSCILDLTGVGNASQFFIASNDVNLIHSLNKISGVPIIRFQNSKMIIQQPTYASKSQHMKDEKLKLNPTEWEGKLLSLTTDPSSSAPPKKKRKLMPNPLSCLKKKTKAPLSVSIDKKSEGRKRRSRRPKKKKMPADFTHSDSQT